MQPPISADSGGGAVTLMEYPADTFPMYDLVQLRQEFPVLAGCIYLDSASTSPTPVRSVAAIYDYFSHYGVNYGRKAHHLARKAAEKYEETRDRLGGFLGVRPDRLVFTRNTTGAIDLVARGICWEAGDEVVTTALEHHANLIPWLALRDRGVKVRVVPQQDGFVRPADLQEAVGPATRLVAVNHLTNVLGTVQPVREFARIAHDAGAAILLDAAQSAGHIPLPDAADFDYLAVPGHKGLLGPQGTGALYLADPDALAVACAGGGMGEEVRYDRLTIQPCPDRFSPGTPDIAAVIGLGPAIGLVEELGVPAIQAHEKAMGDLLWDGLAAIPGGYGCTARREAPSSRSPSIPCTRTRLPSSWTRWPVSASVPVSTAHCPSPGPSIPGERCGLPSGVTPARTRCRQPSVRSGCWQGKRERDNTIFRPVLLLFSPASSYSGHTTSSG